MTTAFIFPGQGSQAVGMGRALNDAHPAAARVFAEVDDALGQPLSKLMFDGPEAELTLTANAQPALMAVSLAALRVLEAEAGLDLERDVVPILLEHAGDGPAMVADGRAAGLWGGGLGWPGFTAVAAMPGGARFVGPSPEAIARVLTARPSLRRMTVPAGSFRGQDAAIETVGSWSLVLARPGLDPEAAHRLVAAIDRAGDGLAKRLPQGRDSDPRNLAGAVPAENLNPGTARYLREVGATR